VNWEAIGAVGEILGAAAVVVTLLYLAIQVRHNTLATSSSTQQIHLDAWNAMSAMIIENLEVAQLLAMNDEEIAALDPVQQVRLEWFATKVFALWEHVYADTLTGLLDTAYGSAFERYYRDTLRMWTRRHGRLVLPDRFSEAGQAPGSPCMRFGITAPLEGERGQAE
jgi:hypothetical protein